MHKPSCEAALIQDSIEKLIGTAGYKLARGPQIC